MHMDIQKRLEVMSKHVDAAIYKGEFWLSVNRPSDYWIFLEMLDKNSDFKGGLKMLFKVFFDQFFSKHPGKWCVVFCREQFTEITELDLREAILEGIQDKPDVSHAFVGLDREKIYYVEDIEAKLPGSNCIIVLALSLHLHLIRRLKREFERRGAKVSHVFTVIERERVSRPVLEAEGLVLIPAMVWQQDADELTVSSVLEHKELQKYHPYFSPGNYISLEELLKECLEHKPSRLHQNLAYLRDKISEELYRKAERVIRGIDCLYEVHNGITEFDTENIQYWLLNEVKLTPQEFKDMAVASFGVWANPDRLEGDGIPHINLANDTMGEKIVEAAREIKREVQILDLGSGTLGTVQRVAKQLEKAGIAARFNAVEFTPELLNFAEKKRPKVVSERIDIMIRPKEMLAFVTESSVEEYHFVTMSYALHHLHPDEQKILMQEVLRCLKPGGLFLIADPQEGKSEFNRKTLAREEPEGVFAIFSSPQQLVEKLTEVGFEDVQILLEDPDKYTGFLVCGVKPKKENV